MTTISFGVEAANDAQGVWVNASCEKDHSQKNLSQLILWYNNQVNQTSEEINNPVYKLTTDKLRPVLISVLIRSICEH